ncbi:MAG: 6,7-dimethyl-8-ribityllumazine synthase [Thermoplasmatota archaeon]
MALDDSFERMLKKSEADAQAFRKGEANENPSPILRAVGSPIEAPAVAKRPVSGPPSGNAHLVDASDEFEVYERPVQPGEPPKSRGLRGAGRLNPPVLPGSRDLVPPELPPDPPRPGAQAPVVVGIPTAAAAMFSLEEVPPAEVRAVLAAAKAPATPTPATWRHAPDSTAPARAPPADNPRIALVQADFNRDITDAMSERAVAQARTLGATVVHHLHVPGAFDLPLAAKVLGTRADVDAVVVVGCVIQGETGHDLVITQACADQIARLACHLEKPIGFAVTGPRMTRAQAEARIGAADHAVASAVAQWRALRTLSA